MSTHSSVTKSQISLPPLSSDVTDTVVTWAYNGLAFHTAVCEDGDLLGADNDKDAEPDERGPPKDLMSFSLYSGSVERYHRDESGGNKVGDANAPRAPVKGRDRYWYGRTLYWVLRMSNLLTETSTLESRFFHVLYTVLPLTLAAFWIFVWPYLPIDKIITTTQLAGLFLSLHASMRYARNYGSHLLDQLPLDATAKFFFRRSMPPTILFFSFLFFAILITALVGVEFVSESEGDYPALKIVLLLPNAIPFVGVTAFWALTYKAIASSCSSLIREVKELDLRVGRLLAAGGRPGHATAGEDVKTELSTMIRELHLLCQRIIWQRRILHTYNQQNSFITGSVYVGVASGALVQLAVGFSSYYRTVSYPFLVWGLISAYQLLIVLTPLALLSGNQRHLHDAVSHCPSLLLISSVDLPTANLVTQITSSPASSNELRMFGDSFTTGSIIRLTMGVMFVVVYIISDWINREG